MEKGKPNNSMTYEEDITMDKKIIDILSKPIPVPFIVKESRADSFINSKKGTNSKLDEIIQKAEKIEKNITHKE